MDWAKKLSKRVFTLKNPEDFFSLALDVFHFQYENNKVYQTFCDTLRVSPADVTKIEEIPFLPVELFRGGHVKAFDDEAAHTFVSSGTTGAEPSVHPVRDVGLYEKSFVNCFRRFYGEPGSWCILALLPSYLERKGSSLVYMAKRLIDLSGHPEGGFYLDDLDGLADKLKKLSRDGQPILLLGVSFALLDLAEQHPMPLKNVIVMETGGMKGRRREMIREELHHVLCSAFHQDRIHSEYGMTELLSQAYSQGGGSFACPPWMSILIRDSHDPLTFTGHQRTGGINVIDLANIYSCSFIATGDLGRTYPDGHFEVLGRFDNSDVRGCNLMVG
ncbi:MAG: acyl transferase [Bacteroidia bacterium]|nr:MAG: acyl transferase [Bacteroidia bacterium]